MFISQAHTHTHTLSFSLLNNLDKTDAIADEDTSCSSVRYTHTHTLSL